MFKNHSVSAFNNNHLKYISSLFLCLIPAVIAAAILFILRLSPAESVEKVYSCGIYESISRFLGFFSKLTTRSISSLIWFFLVVSVIVFIVSFIVFMLRSPDRIHIAGIYLRIIVFAVFLILLLFSVLCMPNYYRLSFAQKAGLSLTDYTVSDLKEMCGYLIEETNAQRSQLSGDTVLKYSDLANGTRDAFNKLNEDYPFMGTAPAVAKPFAFSKILTILNLTGFYFPYTGEANVNTHMPALELPFTMCHELTHTRGFMRENEANYIGFMACMKSDDPFIRYSGLYTALAHSMNMLYSEDTESYWELRKGYSEALSADAAMLNRFWQPYFDTPAADFSNAVNDTYLKANDLKEGIKSYGRMVDLLMARYLENKTLF